jgi:hypothetical protein
VKRRASDGSSGRWSVRTQLREWVALLLLVSGAWQLHAQDAATVPPDGDVYRRIEAISAFFPVPVHLGLRPASQRALRGTLDRLRAAVIAAPLDHPRRRWALRELDRIGYELGDADQARVRTAWRLDAYTSNANPARIDSNGLGRIDATESSFGRDRRGLSYPSGAAVTAMPTGLVAGKRFALLLEPEIGYVTDSGGTDANVRVHRAYGRLVLRNVAVQAGSDHRTWGQSVHGPLFLSPNAAAVPGISVGTDTAIALPWLLRFAGPVQGTLFVGDLGPTQRPPHARLAGWQANINPWTPFELGVAVLVQTGGDGGPPATFLERVIDLFPAIDALAPQHSDFLFSNKIAGGHLRLRFPEASGLDVYYELAIDDFDGRRLRSSMVDDAGHLLGARIAAGDAVLRAEWHRTALRLYEHAQFVSGMTYRQRLLGSPLGPHARAGYASVEWPVREGAFARVTVADERRDPSQYTAIVTGERDRGFQFIRLTDDPDVRRASLVGTLEGSIGALGARVGYGLARSWREGRAARTEWLSRVELRSQVLPWF